MACGLQLGTTKAQLVNNRLNTSSQWEVDVTHRLGLRLSKPLHAGSREDPEQLQSGSTLEPSKLRWDKPGQTLRTSPAPSLHPGPHPPGLRAGAHPLQ